MNHSPRREPGWISRSDREPSLVKGRATREDGTSLPVMLSDLSREGCRLDHDQEALTIGEWIKVEADGRVEMRGQVRWSLLGAAGVRFAGS